MLNSSRLLYISLAAILAGAPAALAAPAGTVTPVVSGVVTPVAPTGRIVTPVTPEDAPPQIAPRPTTPPQLATTGPAAAAMLEKADRVLVIKHLRVMELVRGDGYVMASFPVQLGHHPIGPKVQKGDGRTPEGDYMVSGRDPESLFTLALHVSYPNASDRARARKMHVDPGGSIEIHGEPFIASAINPDRLKTDWTAGCIALTNADMRRVWDQVEDGTPIEIRP